MNAVCRIRIRPSLRRSDSFRVDDTDEVRSDIPSAFDLAEFRVEQFSVME